MPREDLPVKVRSIGDAFLAMAIQFASKKLLIFLATRFPFLAGGPLGWIAGLLVGWIVEKILTLLFDKAEHGIIFLGIEIDVKQEHKAYIEAHLKLQGAETKDEKKKLQKEVDDAFRDFITLK